MILPVFKSSARQLEKMPILTREVVGNLFGRKNVMGPKYQVTGG